MTGFRARLSRITSSGRFIPEIDGLRFVAIAAVVLHHLGEHLARGHGAPARDALRILLAQGFYGVQIFFVISGFILALPFAERRLEGRAAPGLGRYYARRLTRLEPPYLINLVLLAGALVLFRGADAGAVGPHLLASLTYTHGLIYGTASSVNPVAWSLEVEVQFYLLAPFLAAVYSVRSRAARRLLLAAAVLGGGLLWDLVPGAAVPARVHLSLLHYLHFFLLGFLLADWYCVDVRPAPAEGSFAWDVAGLLAAGGVVAGLIRVATPRLLLLPLLGVAFAAAFRGRATRAALRRPWIATLGGMCYTIYLYHDALLAWMAAWTRGAWRPGAPFWANVGLQGLLLVPPVVAVCAVLFALLERPFMRPRGGARAAAPEASPARDSA